MSYNNTVH